MGSPTPDGRGSALTPDELWRELRARGSVTLEAAQPATRVVAGVFLGLSLLTPLAGVVLVLTGAPTVGLAAFGLTGFWVLAAVTVGRAGRGSRGSWWTVDRNGVTINGVGPVPWSDVEPTTRRMEQTLYDEGRALTLVMPLNEWGIRRAAALPPMAKQALDPGRSRRLFGGERPLTALRVPSMKGISAVDFARFLDGALNLARHGLL